MNFRRNSSIRWAAALAAGTVALSLALGASTPDRLNQMVDRMNRGEYEKVERELLRMDRNDPHVLRLLLELQARTGRGAEADAQARRLLDLDQSGRLQREAGTAQAALAAWHLQRWKQANQLFLEATQQEGVPVSAWVDWGHLYLEKFNAAEAETIFLEGAQRPQAEAGFSRWDSDALYVGLARALKSQFKPGASKALERALELNPKNLEAMFLRSQGAMEEDDWDEADRWIEEGLQHNAQFLPLMELRCARKLLGGERQRFEACRDAVLDINPRNGRMFETLGDLFVSKRRLQEAVVSYRKALQRDSRRWSALASLGINLLRLGEEAEGRQVLEEAYAQDPYNIWTVNTLRLIDSFDGFELFDANRFSVRLHRKEAVALRPYVARLLLESLTVLEEKYAHRVREKVLFEMYPDHEDFAVRALGLPGLGALGATFGRIVAMDSPSARPEGKFHWGSTLWHEVAHVITLSLSDQKMPRWLSEGISMMEERLARPGWGDHLSIEFLEAHRSGTLLSLSQLNSGFERPQNSQQLRISYYQAGWVCQWLVDRFGLSKVRDLVAAYRQDKTSETCFQEALGQSLEEVDRQVKAAMESQLNPLMEAMDRSIITALELPRGGDPETAVQTLMGALQKHPGNYFLNLELGRRLVDSSREAEATAYLDRAIEIFPYFSDRGSPYDLLLEIHQKAEREDLIVDLLRSWWRVDPRFGDNAIQLAELIRRQGDLQEAVRYLEEVMYVDPLRPDVHQSLGELYLQDDRPRDAAQEFRVLLSLGTPDPAAAHYGMARAFWQAGDRQAARRQVLHSLEIAPNYKEAQLLLLQIAQP